LKRRFHLSDPPFAGLTGAGVRVAVIDSGVHASHPHVGAVEECVCLDPPDGDTVDRLGHGTAVAAAIRDIAPGTTLLVGKIFDRSLSTNAAALARGIDWAVERKARVINLSLGTANPAHAATLGESVSRATTAGVIVVSARLTGGSGVVWLPGSIEGVASVVADSSLERDELEINEQGFVAAPYPRPIPGVPRERNLSGVSFAVANVSGFLARLLEVRADLRGLNDLKSALRQEDCESDTE
jgi:subtilisin family serine protease